MKRYAISYKAENLTESEIEARRAAGERFGVCDAFIFCPISKDEKGEILSVDLVSQDMKAAPTDLDPSKLEGGPLPMGNWFYVWLAMAKILMASNEIPLTDRALCHAVLKKISERSEEKPDGSPSI